MDVFIHESWLIFKDLKEYMFSILQDNIVNILLSNVRLKSNVVHVIHD